MKYPLVFASMVVWIAPSIDSQKVHGADPATIFGRMELSLPNRPAAAGLRMKVRLGATPVVGYVPIDIELDSALPFSAQRRFTLRCEPYRQTNLPATAMLSVELPLVAEQGESRVRVRRHLPKWTLGVGARLTLLEDDLPVAGLSGLAQVLDRGNSYPMQTLPRETHADIVVLMGRESAESMARDRLHPMRVASGLDLEVLTELSGVNATSPQTPFLSPSAGRTQAIAIEELPTDWRSFDGIDVAVVGHDALVKLTDRAESFAALRAWVMTGGTLVAAGGGGDSGASSRSQVIDRLGISDPTSNFGNATTGLPPANLDRLRLWTDAIAQARQSMPATMKENDTSNFPMLDRLITDGSRSVYYDAASLEIVRTGLDRAARIYADALAADPPGRDGWQVPLGAGRVIGLPAANPDGLLNTAELTLVLDLIGSGVSPTIRRGVDPMLGDSRFSQWLIPGVAQPPVYILMGLLTVFAILVGPVAYLKTTRNDRGYLMFLIAPALALVTTTSMFVYSSVSDGFGIRGRVRQITLVDGASGMAVDQVRATYFAGLRPRQPLVFPAAAEVMRYPDATGETFGMIRRRTRNSDQDMPVVVINDRTQRFESTLLPSRDQRQFMLRYATSDVGTVSIAVADSSATISNNMTIDIAPLFVRDRGGRYWTVERLTAGQSGQAIQLDKKTGDKEVGKLYSDNRLVSARSNRRRGGRRGNLTFETDQWSQMIPYLNGRIGMTGLMITDGAIESRLQRILQTNGELSPGMFLGLAEIDPQTVALEDVELSESIRFVLGTLP